MKKTFCAILAILVLSAFLVSCAGDPLVGKWHNDEQGFTFVFKNDGTGYAMFGSVKPLSFTYGASAGSLTVTFPLSGETETFTYAFVDGTLELTQNGVTDAYVRQ